MRRAERVSSDLRIYVPELWTFREKDSPACRKLLEDVAVLDPVGRRILASRGGRFEKALPQKIFAVEGDRVLLPDRAGCFLLFSGFCSGINLMLALYLNHPAKEVSSALRLLERTDFIGLTGQASVGQELFDLLAEVLFYLDGLLAGTRYLPLRTLVLRAANFAGCRLKKVDLPMQNLQLDPNESALFLAFLICFFLSVRASGGVAEADTEEGASLSVRLSALSEETDAIFPEDAPFLHCDAFCRFRLVGEGRERAVILPIQKPTSHLSSGGRAAYLSILLECDGD